MIFTVFINFELYIHNNKTWNDKLVNVNYLTIENVLLREYGECEVPPASD